MYYYDYVGEYFVYYDRLIFNILYLFSTIHFSFTQPAPSTAA